MPSRILTFSDFKNSYFFNLFKDWIKRLFLNLDNIRWIKERIAEISRSDFPSKEKLNEEIVIFFSILYLIKKKVILNKKILANVFFDCCYRESTLILFSDLFIKFEIEKSPPSLPFLKKILLLLFKKFLELVWEKNILHKDFSYMCRSNIKVLLTDEFNEFEIEAEVVLEEKEMIINFFLEENTKLNPPKKIELLPSIVETNKKTIAFWDSGKYFELVVKIVDNKKIFFNTFFKLNKEKQGKEIKKFFEDKLNELDNKNPLKKLLLEETNNILNSLNKLRGEIFKSGPFKKDFENISENDRKMIGRLYLDSYFLIQNFLILSNLDTELKKK